MEQKISEPLDTIFIDVKRNIPTKQVDNIKGEKTTLHHASSSEDSEKHDRRKQWLIRTAHIGSRKEITEKPKRKNRKLKGR